VSELDVLLRILQQKHKIEIAKTLRSRSEDSLQSIPKRFRLFQLDGDNGVRSIDHTISGELSHICRAEIVTEGPLVNDMSLPIVPGDVFAPLEVGEDVLQEGTAWWVELEVGKSYLMLLGQLCDIVPRGDIPRGGHWRSGRKYAILG
jgi:hypothetical protein